MNPPRRGLGDADDTTVSRDDDFSLDGVAFFLAGIPTTLFAAWPLNRLFRAVNDQGFGLLAADVDRALAPRTRAARVSMRRRARLTVDLSVWYRHTMKSCVMAQQYRISRTRR